MKNTVFKGIATAMITPMTSTGVDYDTLSGLSNFRSKAASTRWLP